MLIRFVSRVSEHLSKKVKCIRVSPYPRALAAVWRTIVERKLDTKDKLIDENGNVAENKIYYIIRRGDVDGGGGGRILTYITRAICDSAWTWSIVVVIIITWYSTPADTVLFAEIV